MRFIEGGPSIPDELLIARDEGRVVFFCGAGVSMARARLPNFFNLANKVIQKLGVPVDDPVNKILIEAEEIQARTGIAGLISVDRIFGLLERDFEISDIESAVAEVLKPVFGIDLSAHHILLDLATTADNKVRLVTTNFDRLFEDCNSNLKVWHPPRLPDPLRPNEMDGVVYLHGRTNKDYSDSDGDGFILSSSDFGRAYLSEGWATTFFKNILDRYIVVFIGYSADDPPIQYLLEALNKKASQLSGVYAFQSGVTDVAAARWRHKGVEAITYSDANRHCALWNTLEAWSVRAKDPEKWHQSIMDLARSRPESLQPYERGQVGHIISTLEGARRFAESDPSPPAEWLCVFDPYRRYAKPGYIGRLGSQRQFVDPFDLYGLDSDITPNKYDPDDYSAKREVPADAWDAFIANRLDHQNLSENNLAAIYGHWAINAAVLPPRMYQIGAWISKVASQPTSIWWAARRAGLHPDIQQKIKYQIYDSKNDTSLAIRKSWRYLFESWEHKINDYQQDWYDLVDIINKEGWDNSIVRKFAAIHRAHLSIKQSFWNNPIPPLENKNAEINELLNLEIHYPEIPNDANIPNEWLSPIVCELRKNLEYALQLETELGSIGLSIVNPIIPDEKPNEDNYERTHGLSETVIFFAHLFERLIEIDPDMAHQEFVAWPSTDDTIFSRLRIWACGKSGLTSPQIVGQIVMGLNDMAFWDIYHQRDLLLVLAKRWHELQPDTHKEIEKRLLKGPTKYDIEEDNNEFEETRARQTLNRITWLKNNNCDFSFNLEIESNELRQIATNWKPEYAMKAAESLVGGSGGFVRTDTEHSSLLNETLGSILSKSRELSGRTDDFLVEKDPFSGLSKQYPTLAFRALSHAARRNEYPNWAWKTFLNSETRGKDKPKLSALIAERISRYEDKNVADFIYSASDWLLKTSEQLALRYPKSFYKVISKFIDIFRSQPNAGNTSIVRSSKNPGWRLKALNAPVGKVAQALLNDPKKADAGFPPQWLAYVEKLLSLDGDMRRHAITIFCHHIDWLNHIDPSWSEINLLSILNSDDTDDCDAFWDGFFWRTNTPDQKLYIRMKPNLLAIAQEKSLAKQEYSRVLAAIILAGWGTKNKETQERLVSDNEIRDVLVHTDDNFRCHILEIIKELSTKENDSDYKWSGILLPFLRNLWPRQISVRTPTVSAKLFALAFSNVECFQERAEVIQLLLTPIGRNHLMLPHLKESKEEIVDLYPSETLTLLDKVLPDNVKDWPWNIEKYIQRICEANESLNSDERLIEIRRKWNAR